MSSTGGGKRPLGGDSPPCPPEKKSKKEEKTTTTTLIEPIRIGGVSSTVSWTRLLLLPASHPPHRIEHRLKLSLCCPLGSHCSTCTCVLCRRRRWT